MTRPTCLRGKIGQNNGQSGRFEQSTGLHCLDRLRIESRRNPSTFSRGHLSFLHAKTLSSSAQLFKWDASPGVSMWSACFWLYRREWTHSKELPLHLPIPASSPPCLLPRLLLQERKPRGNCRLESFGTPGLTEREGLPKRDSATPFRAHSQSNSLGTRRVSSIRYEHSTRGCASSSETLDRARKTNWNLSLIFILRLHGYCGRCSIVFKLPILCWFLRK